MSTKTTFKRIALVAVAALGMGVLTSVSAQAANAVTSVTVSTQAPFRAGVQSAVAITLGGTFDGSATNVGAKVTSAPVGSSTSAISFESIPQSGDRSFALDAGSQAIFGTVGEPTDSTSDTGTASVAFTAGASTTSGKFNLLFTPHVAGTYQILVWSNATSYSAGLPSAVISITTAGAPVSAVMTTVASTFAASNAATDSKGTRVKITLKDSAGNATIPNANESVDVSASGQATVSTVGIAGDAQSAGEFESYGSSSFKYGSVFVAVDNTAAETITLTASVSGTSAGTLGSIALTTKAANVTVVADDAIAIPSALSTLGTANTGGYTTADGSTTSTNLTAQTLQVTITDPAAAAYVGFEVIDTDGVITGLIGATIHPVVAVASGDTKAYLSLSASLGLLTSTQYTVEPIAGTSVAASTGTALVVTGGTAAAHTMSNGTPAVIRVATGATPVIKARVTNQFGGGVAGVAVTASIAGRNSLTTITSNLVTDASGYVSFTYTDASTSTTVLTDTVTFTMSTASSDTTGTATVTFGTVTVDDVAVTGAASEDVAPTVTYSNISAAKAGPDGASVAITAEVTDVNGSVLAGVPVTFAISGVAGAAIRKTATTDFTTVYTGTDGTATTYIIGWETGKTTVTATAGGKSGTGAINWRSGTTAANATVNARVLSATVTGDIVSMKVVDRFGNPVPNTTINLSRVGAGLFGNGASTQDVVTDATGTADVRFTGSGKVTAELATTYTQAYAAKDFVAGGVATPVAFTAAVAGTTVGTGASFAPAGIASVTVDIAAGASVAETNSQAAADAAAEATDAANAATDAANAAAEAADAATAAAQDAADAVAALSTQVSEMVNALKKQITALTNLVIKIQKKVKA